MRLPDGWMLRRLDEIAELGGGVTLGREVSGSGTVELPYLRVANVQDGHIDLSEIKTVRVFKHELPRYRLEPGDVLMTEGGDFDKLGRGAVWGGEIEPCLHQNHVFRVRTDKRAVLPDYLAAVSASEIGKRYFLQSSKQTTNLASINSTQLRAFPVPCPPLDEQDRITEVLNAADVAIQQTEAVITKLRQMKAGLLHDLLTRGVDEQGRLRDPATHPEQFKDSPLGRFPRCWQIESLGKTCSLIKDGTHLPPTRVQDGPLLLSVQNMIDGNFVLTSNDTRVSWGFYRSMHANWSIREGDVLLAVVGATIGKTAMVPRLPPFTLQRSVAVLRGSAGLLQNDFLFYWLNTPHFQTTMWQRANQTAQPGIYLGEIAGLRIPLPDFQEQERISKATASLDLRIKKEEVFRDKLKLQKRGLMHDLLTGRVRV